MKWPPICPQQGARPARLRPSTNVHGRVNRPDRRLQAIWGSRGLGLRSMALVTSRRRCAPPPLRVSSMRCGPLRAEVLEAAVDDFGPAVVTFRPCLDCGEPTDQPRCTDCRTDDNSKGSARSRRYDTAWHRLSRKARSSNRSAWSAARLRTCRRTTHRKPGSVRQQAKRSSYVTSKSCAVSTPVR